MVWLEVTFTFIDLPVRVVPDQPENSYPCWGVAVIETEVFSLYSPPEVLTLPPSEAETETVNFCGTTGVLSSPLLQVKMKRHKPISNTNFFIINIDAAI
jgi:hypothetical protein